MKRVMVFGVFDGVDEGHRAFFEQARRYGDTLLAVVAPDPVAKRLKGRPPALGLRDRIARLKVEKHVDDAVQGDACLSSWNILETYPADVIALGYDQDELREDLEAHLSALPCRPRVVVTKPVVCHTSVS